MCNQAQDRPATFKVWKLRDSQKCSCFHDVFKAHVSTTEFEANATTEEIWTNHKTAFLWRYVAQLGLTCDMTWWWNKCVKDAITAKQQVLRKAGNCTQA